jgi:hypothetical protein
VTAVLLPPIADLHALAMRLELILGEPHSSTLVVVRCVDDGIAFRRVADDDARCVSLHRLDEQKVRMLGRLTDPHFVPGGTHLDGPVLGIT